ncbi:MAG TPA: hypothetical protein VLC53_17820, partial [Myxococcota bacterium]|nr:hypothetical protein [Myxococcota bacterium]
RREGLSPPRARDLGPLAVVLAAAFLVACIGGRSGLPDAAGTLVFFGRHTTADPLTYTAVAQQLAERGYPIELPLVSGLPNLGHALFFGELVGLRFAGRLDPLDVAFRVRPLLDVATLGLSALALARVLGASPPGAALAGVLTLLGGGLSQLAYAVLHAFEWPVRQVEAWGLETAFLLPVNPIAPALQTAFAAIVVLAIPSANRMRAAWVAGVLAAAVLELKLFLWPPLVAGLALSALWARDRELRRPLGVAAGMAVAAALPALVEKLVLAARLGDGVVVGLEPCAGCVPRFLLAWSFGSAVPDRATLGGDAGSLADPSAWVLGGAAAVAVWALLLGARALALPRLLRGAFGRTEATVPAAYRVLLGAGCAGLALSFLTTTPPHPLNAMQFAWAATFPLWAVLGVVLGGWLQARRHLRVSLALALALPGGLFWIIDQGALAPVHGALGFEEQQLLATLAAESRPGDLVLEPSLLVAPHSVSPVAWRAGRPVFLSHDGAAHYLPAAERERRRALLARAFDLSDLAAAGAAIRESGARFVHAPAERPLPIRGVPGLELLRANAGGAVFRVVEPGS